MKRGTNVLLAALSLAAFVAGGCANKEVVKAEEPVVKPVVAEPARPEPPKPAPVKVEPKVEPPKPVEVQAAKASVAEISLEAIYFDFDMSDLSQAARDVLSKNAETLIKVRPDAKVRIEGNCDERGSAEYNLALGERRAKSALQYLLTLGVPADRLSVISYGKERAAVNATDESVWAKDRRDDFVIVK